MTACGDIILYFIWCRVYGFAVVAASSRTRIHTASNLFARSSGSVSILLGMAVQLFLRFRFQFASQTFCRSLALIVCEDYQRVPRVRWTAAVRHMLGVKFVPFEVCIENSCMEWMLNGLIKRGILITCTLILFTMVTLLEGCCGNHRWLGYSMMLHRWRVCYGWLKTMWGMRVCLLRNRKLRLSVYWVTEFSDTDPLSS